MLELPDDIPAASETLIPLPASYVGHSFIAGIRSNENSPQSCSTTIDSQLVSTATSALQILAITWDRVRVATTSYQEVGTLLKFIENGFPQFRHELPTALQLYYQFRDHLYTVDGVILYKDRIIIPPSLRQHIYDCTGQVNHILARHNTRHCIHKMQLWSLQLHGTFTTKCTTLPSTNLPLSVHLR